MFTKAQYSAHCSSLFVLEALSREFHSKVPGKTSMPMTLLSSLNHSRNVRRLLSWKEAMEEKGLTVNAGKMKIMTCGKDLDLLQSSGEFPCAVCRTGVGSNSIFCNGCKHWVHGAIASTGCTRNAVGSSA